MNHLSTSTLAALGLLLSVPLFTPKPRVAEDASAIVARAVQATKNLKSLQYTIETSLPDEPKIRATVFCQRAEVPQPGPMSGIYWVDGLFDRGGSRTEKFAYSYDGKAFRFRLDGGQKVQLLERPALAEVAATLSLETALCTIDPFAFPQQISPNVRYLREANIGGRLCDVVEVSRQVTGKGGTLEIVSQWGIDRKTSLPVYFSSENGSRKTIVSMTVNPPSDPGRFRLAGAEKESENEVKLDKADVLAKGLLPVGAAAPDFAVQEGSGRPLSLAAYRGKLLLVDFWGTWCLPCVKAMPYLKRLHSRYGSRGLSLVSMAVADSKGDPAGFMKARGYGWTCVPRGESAAKAYQVTMFPTLYLIGEDGKVLFRVAGAQESTQAALESLIEKHLSR